MELGQRIQSMPEISFEHVVTDFFCLGGATSRTNIEAENGDFTRASSHVARSSRKILEGTK